MMPTDSEAVLIFITLMQWGFFFGTCYGVRYLYLKVFRNEDPDKD